MFKIIFTDERAVLHTLLVYHITTDSELTDDRCAPLAKLCSTNAVYTITDRNDRIKVIKQCFSGYLPSALDLNYREKLGS